MPTGLACQAVTVGICGDASSLPKASWRSSLRQPATPDARSAKRSFIRPSRAGSRRFQHGSRGRRSRHHVERRRTQAGRRLHVAAAGLARDSGGLPKDAIISSDIETIAPSAMPTRRSTRAGSTWRPAFRALRLWFPSIIGAKIGNPDTPCVGFAGTAHSEFP
jgi:sulfoacetaldehyde acetyltransferase